MKKLVKTAAVLMIIFTLGFCLTGVIGHVPAITASAAVLQQGSRGSDVTTLQRKLKNWGYYSGSVDGIFGSQTREAVRYFQRKNGLVVDGIVGKKTLAALGMSLGGSSGSTSGYSDSDISLLARLIYGEARGESYTGQVAVGAVVLNRVRSSSFPNTIAGVIYQPYAFTAVSDGQINLTPNATARKAAIAAMNGWDPSYGAIYYYNPSTATSSWIFSRQTTVVIGDHVFAI
ncbi:MAG: spore cortex-lytic enzyme [Eubacteriales bacterium]